jgi:uncharacterized membrane protein YqaE (UPF0057 family)
MNRNWIVLVLAIVSLASCSVEKRVYQPGYHIEWNHYAEQDVAQDAMQDASRDVSQDASRDLPQDLSENLEIDVSQDATQDASRDVAQDASQDASRDVAQDASQDASGDVTQDVTQDASRNVTQGVSRIEKLGQIVQEVSPIQNISVKSESKLGPSIDSDLEMILFIVLALFLPALTIFLLEGFSKNFWIALLLMVLAFALPLPIFLKLMIQAIATVLAIAVVFHYL